MRYSSSYCLVALALIAGCASNPNKIDAAYVSPLKYKNYDCDQIAMEMDHVGRRTTILEQSLQKERTADNWQMGVGLVLFWPALFALEGGDGPEATEFAQLKGDYEALRTVSVEKKCSIDTRSPEQIIAGSDNEAREEARQKVSEFEVKHREQVKGIATAKSCEEYASLLEVSETSESWLLGCGNGKSIRIECADKTCIVTSGE